MIVKIREKLEATNAGAVRQEVKRRWPNCEVNIIGYDRNGQSVYITLVRRDSDNTPVATAKRNRSLPAVSFYATSLKKDD